MVLPVQLAPAADGPATDLASALLARARRRAAGPDQLHGLVLARHGGVALAEAFRGLPLDRPVNVESVIAAEMFEGTIADLIAPKKRARLVGGERGRYRRRPRSALGTRRDRPIHEKDPAGLLGCQSPGTSCARGC
jgi:hypothetical protein